MEPHLTPGAEEGEGMKKWAWKMALECILKDEVVSGRQAEVGLDNRSTVSSDAKGCVAC